MRLQTPFGSKKLVFYTIAVMFGLVTVSLSYDVQQCEQTVHTDLINVENVDGSMWFKWARVFSFCRNFSSVYDHGCRTRDCKDCLDVCLMDVEIRNVTSLCEQNCTTNACKEGCRFYAKVFTKKDDSNVTFDTRIRKPIVNASMKINDSSDIYGIDLSWASVFSDDASITPSLYLITLRANENDKNEYIITLTENSSHSVEIKDMCRNVHSTFHNEIDLKFAFTIYPINFVGPEDYTEAKDSKIYVSSSYIRPVELPSVKNISVSKPFFKNSDRATYDHIVWEIGWKNSSITEGFRFMYNILNCPDFRNRIEITMLNPKKVNVKKEEPFRMSIANTKDDKLDKCSILLELRARQGQCFFGNPYKKTIQYDGCKTIPGYPYPCGVTTRPIVSKDKLIYEFNATTIAAECVNISLYACPQNENITCQYCQTTKHRIKVTWEHPPYKLIIKEYTIRWGEMSKLWFIDPKMARTATITKNNSSYIIEFSANETKTIGIQVHAETPISESKKIWEMKINSTKQIKLKPVEPKPLSPTLAPKKNENNSPTIIAVVVVLIFAVCCSLTLYIIYRRRSNSKKNFKSDEIKMEDRQGTVTADKWEISSSILTMDEKIGEGAFGHVYCAIIKTSELRKTPYAEQCSDIKLMGESTKVAAKFVKDGAEEMEYKDFYEEITLMKDIGYHEHIVNMIGCSTITRPLCLVLEYMNRGDLLHYMRVFRKNEICAGAALSAAAVAGAGDVLTEKGEYLSPRDVMSFSWQIACGMEYLSINNVVHRDLAARNILISDDKKIKISDFGLSRFVSDELIYVSNNKNRKLPIKWMSIEAIYHQEFTTFSDVWAYGVVLFEIVTLGGTPYPSIGNRELCKMLKSGYRMDKPDNCEDTVYDMMLHCWNEIPTERPTFTELREHLEDLVEKGEMYFSFDIDENDTYYNVASFKSIPSDADNDDDAVFRNEFVEKPIQMKSLNRSRESSIKSRNSSLKSRTSKKSDELRVDVDSNRYFSPQSINVFKESKNYSSFDNQGFDDENEKK